MMCKEQCWWHQIQWIFFKNFGMLNYCDYANPATASDDKSVTMGLDN
jgi:hypothetical protein